MLYVYKSLLYNLQMDAWSWQGSVLVAFSSLEVSLAQDPYACIINYFHTEGLVSIHLARFSTTKGIVRICC
jgi:uncharacterized protein YdhG (YjbR/CyaY superfamily)